MGKVTLVLAAAGILIAFQNCSQTKFSAQSASLPATENALSSTTVAPPTAGSSAPPVAQIASNNIDYCATLPADREHPLRAFTMKGVVTDAVNKKPIANVTVYLKANTMNITSIGKTDADGKYLLLHCFSDIDDAQHTLYYVDLAAQSVGYRNQDGFAVPAVSGGVDLKQDFSLHLYVK